MLSTERTIVCDGVGPGSVCISVRRCVGPNLQGMTSQLVVPGSCRTELTEVFGTGLMLHRTYRSVRCRYRCCTDTGTGTDVYTGTGGIGVDFVPNLSKCPVPVMMLYRTYRSVGYRYETMYPYRNPYRTKLTEVPYRY